MAGRPTLSKRLGLERFLRLSDIDGPSTEPGAP